MNVRLDDLINLLDHCGINVIDVESEFYYDRERFLVLDDIGINQNEFEANRITQIRLCGYWFYINPVSASAIQNLADVMLDGYRVPGVIRDYSLGDINLLIEK